MTADSSILRPLLVLLAALALAGCPPETGNPSPDDDDDATADDDDATADDDDATADDDDATADDDDATADDDDDDATADDDDSASEGYEIYEATVSYEFTEECGADFWTLDPVHEFTVLNLELDYDAADALGHNTGFRIWSGDGLSAFLDVYGGKGPIAVPDLSDGSVIVGLLQADCAGGAEAHVVGADADAKGGGTLGASIWSCADCDCSGFTWLFLQVPGEALNYGWAECQGSWHQ